MGVNCEIPHRLEKEMSANEDTGYRREVDCEISHWLEREMNMHVKLKL